MLFATQGENRLREVERKSWWLAVGLTGATGVWCTPHFTLSVLSGGLVMALNFYLWRALVGSLLRAQGDRTILLGATMVKIMAKFVALIGTSAFLFVYGGVHPVGFLVGTTNLLLAAVLVGVGGSQPKRASSRLENRS